MSFVDLLTYTSEWMLENIEAVVATTIAACAMFSTYWQAKLTREHNRLSVKPHLVISLDFSRNNFSLKFQLKNNGLGPAIISSYKLLVLDTELNTLNFKDSSYELWELFKGAIPDNGSTLSLHSRTEEDSLAQGECIDLLCLNKIEGIDPLAFNNDLIQEKLKNIRFEIEYESFYGDKLPKISFQPSNLG